MYMIFWKNCRNRLWWKNRMQNQKIEKNIALMHPFAKLNRVPLEGTFELTVRCNLHCKMCLFRHDDCENYSIMERELTTEQWIQMAKNVAAEGTVQLLLTGGEAMLRPDFCELYEGIYKQGFLLTLYTNATVITPKIMETLKKYPPHKIGVTIYGATSETYEKVCGSKDALARAIQGIHYLQELPSILDFRTTIIKDNYHEADAIEALVHREFGEQYNLTQTRIVTKAVRGACADVESCRLEPEDNIRLAYRRGINIIKKYVGDAFDEKNLYAEYRQEPSDKSPTILRASLFGCPAGMNSYTISWDGKLLGCQMMECFAVNIQDCNFSKAWEAFPKNVKLPPMNQKCRECKSFKICNSCYASRYAETGDVCGLPEYVCKDTAIVQKLIDNGGRR